MRFDLRSSFTRFRPAMALALGAFALSTALAQASCSRADDGATTSIGEGSDDGSAASESTSQVPAEPLEDPFYGKPHEGSCAEGVLSELREAWVCSPTCTGPIATCRIPASGDSQPACEPELAGGGSQTACQRESDCPPGETCSRANLCLAVEYWACVLPCVERELCPDHMVCDGVACGYPRE